MKKRQEKPYTAQLGAMSDLTLTTEIGTLVSAAIEGKDVAEHLRLAQAEDDKRGGSCYPAAMKLYNESIGWKEISPRNFEINVQPQA